VSKSRKQVFDELIANGIGVNVHYIPIYTQPYYLRFGFNKDEFENSEMYYKRAISIPIFSSMSLDQQDKIVNTIKEVLL